METDIRTKPAFSEEYREFWRIRGGNADLFDQLPRPATPEELAKAETLTDKLLGVLTIHDFDKIRPNLVSLAAEWMRNGLITEAQHMKIVRTKEALTDGETYEQYIAKLPRS